MLQNNIQVLAGMREIWFHPMFSTGRFYSVEEGAEDDVLLMYCNVEQ